MSGPTNSPRHLEESSQGFTGIGAPKPWLSATKMVEKTIHGEENGGGVSLNNLSLIIQVINIT